MTTQNLDSKAGPSSSVSRRLKIQWIRDLKEKDPVSAPFLVKFSSVGTDKNGKPFMNLVLMDKTGELESRVWEDVARVAGQAVRDSFVWVDGKVQAYQGRRQIVVNRVQVLRDGASAAYGADAIAGVVNIITKNRQDGLTASAQIGQTDHSDGFSQDYNVTWEIGRAHV